MNVATFEGVVENGQIHLPADVRLPDNTRVFVVVPGMQVQPVGHLLSPRLAHPEEAVDFRMEVVTEPADAGV